MLDPIGADRWSPQIARKYGIREALFVPVAGR
jgi:hypothetical protein